MNVIYETGTGEILGVNRAVLPGESSVQVTLAELIHGMDNEFYEVVDGFFTPKEPSEVASIIAQREADAAAGAARLADINSARAASGIKQYTVEQVSTYLDNRFDEMTNLETCKTELRKIFDKLIPYILEG